KPSFRAGFSFGRIRRFGLFAILNQWRRLFPQAPPRILFEHAPARKCALRRLSTSVCKHLRHQAESTYCRLLPERELKNGDAACPWAARRHLFHPCNPPPPPIFIPAPTPPPDRPPPPVRWSFRNPAPCCS